MFGKSFSLWLSSILIVTQNFSLSEGIVVEKWIKQKQDHFDYDNGKIWLMRYYENNQFYHQSGPIFIKIGGQREITPTFIEDTSSFVYILAEAHGAMMYNTEHRYYGKSHPVPDTSLENLRYLTIPQALADIALFIDMKKIELNNSNAFIMVFGDNYAGNLAAWMRVVYPNLVQGALASSAPIYVKADFFEFCDLIENSIRKYDENCLIIIQEAFSVLEQLLKSPVTNSIIIEYEFKICSDFDLSQPSEVPYMIFNLANIISDIVSYNKIEKNGETSIENLCMSMRSAKNISPYYGLAKMLKGTFLGNNSCITSTYKGTIEEYLQTSWESRKVTERLLFHQSCTQLGYHRAILSPNSIFGSLLTEEYFDNMCRDIFTAAFNLDYLNYNIRRINHLYNSELSTTKNIIFTNGDLDPWRTLSVISDLNPDSPAISIDGASHCTFLTKIDPTQRNSITAARCRVFFIIYDWLHIYKDLHGSLPMEISI